MFCQLNKILTFIFSILIVNISFGQTSLYNNIDFRVDSLINSSISQKAFPGAQVYIKIGEEILTNKSFGYHTYDSIVKVENNHVNDLASLTKVLSSTIALMKLYEDFDLNLNDPVSKYFPELKKSNKKNTTFNEVLSHTSGWTPYINHHYLLKRKKGELKRSIIRNKKSKRFNLKVSKNLFLRESYHKKIFKRIKKSEVNIPGEYLYSGLFFFYVPRLVEKITCQKYEDYLNGTFYQNIKNNSLGFNPSDYSNVVPTEQDDFFRNTLVHGTVHDEAASLFGGKSGNAGLFGSAQSIGELIKVLETWAFNNSNTLLKKSTITKFTEYAIPESNIRRGLGFDKPTREIEKNYPNKNLSEQSFGHTGFTGTFFWTDPKAKLSIVFLTNRVYPTRQNQKLYEKNIRSKLLDIVFEWSKQKDEK